MAVSHAQMVLVVKNPPANAGDTGDFGSIPGLGRSPGEGNGNPFYYSWWEIVWTEEPGGLQFTGSQRVRHDWVTEHEPCQDMKAQSYEVSLRLQLVKQESRFLDFLLQIPLIKSLQPMDDILK